MESRVELFARIRRDARVEGLSVRALAARHKVHRRTVRQALEAASPPERKPRRGVAWRLEPFKAAIDEMLIGDTTAPRKQRHTARRILARLIEEHATADASPGGAAADRDLGAHADREVQRVVSLTQRRLMDPAAVIAGLPRDTRPLPTVNAYDELLAKRSSHTTEQGTASKENIS